MEGEVEEVQPMSEDCLHRDFEKWPLDPEEREALAREVFGEHIVAAYDGWLKVATDMLFSGYRHKSPSEEQRTFLDWIGSLDVEERVPAFAFVRELLDGLVFSLLNEFDGNTGFVLQRDVREQLLVGVELAPWEGDSGWAGEPVEAIVVNSRRSREEKGIELHRLWFHWKERYSRWDGRREP